MNIVTLGLGSTPSGVILLGYHWGDTPPAPDDESVSGGWISPEQARAVIRKIRRGRAEKARRAEEIQEAIEAAVETDDITPVRDIIERDTGMVLLPMLGDLQAALDQLAFIDQQVATIAQRRMDDAAAVLLLTEL
jgi:hypothetical protein